MSIQEIKEKLRIITVLDHYGITVNKNNMVHCPFHDDKTPSMQVYPETDTVFCFSGNCEKTGKAIDVIDFIMHKENVTKREAIEKAKELAGLQTTTITRTEILTKLYAESKESYKRSKKARDYAASRNLEEVELGFITERFYHGWTKEEKEAALRIHLLKQQPNGQLSPMLRNCLLFAMKDKQGDIVNVYGRSLQDTNKSQRHYYLKGGHQGFYPKYPSKETKRLILTESIIDAVSLSTHYSVLDTQILACYGTNGFTQEHKAAISELPDLEEIIFAFDGDGGGQKAVLKYQEYFAETYPKLILSQLEIPEGEDVNSLLQSHPVENNGTGEPEIFTHLIKHRKELKGLLDPSATGVADVVPSEVATTFEASLPSSNKKDTGVPPYSVLHTLYSKNPNNITYRTATTYYQIKGGLRKDLDSLKITLVIEHLETKTKSRSKLDLYEDRQTEKVAREAAEKLHLEAEQIEEELNHLTDLLDEYRTSLTTTNEEQTPKQIILTAEAKKQSLKLLKSQNLLTKINALIGKSGVVGEENNRLFLFGIASSYKMSDTLHALIQGSSGSGKTHLLATIMDFMPPEDTISLTRVTESSFYNYGQYELENKLIGIEDYDGLEEKAELAFRELQSKGMISSSTSGKNEQTGEITGFIKTVYGPIASLSATTKGEIYEDNMSRCFLVAVDESHEQTLRIIKYQNQRAAGKIDKETEKTAAELLRNSVRLLKPYEVVNPYADKIELPQEAHKIRRLNDLFQSYVKQVTLLNQYQREKDEKDRLITAKEDIKTAIEIMFESIILKVDELDGSLRLFYEKLKTYVESKSRGYEFIQREIRHALKISKTQLFRYVHQLEELEYVQKRGSGSHGAVKYKIVYWDNNEALRARIKNELTEQLERL